MKRKTDFLFCFVLFEFPSSSNVLTPECLLWDYVHVAFFVHNKSHTDFDLLKQITVKDS